MWAEPSTAQCDKDQGTGCGPEEDQVAADPVSIQGVSADIVEDYKYQWVHIDN